MRHFQYVEVENFKRFGSKVRVELHHPSVLVGPNNCGKTSVIQALALWSQIARSWLAKMEGSSATKRTGRAVNRKDILTVPVPETRFFWNDLKTSRNVRISVGFSFEGEIQRLTMRVKYHPSNEIVYCSATEATAKHMEALQAAATVDVALLYPMSGIAADEAVVTPARINYYLGRGSTAEVLRNLCLLVYENAPADWQAIEEHVHRLFQINLHRPQRNAQGSIDLAYAQSPTEGLLDISMAGRGVLQTLLLLAYLYSRKGSVVLVDEPDTHLEILRQRQIYTLLREVATQHRSQLVFVTHSEVVLEEALDDSLTLLLGDRAREVVQRTHALNALKHYGAANYVRAAETGYVLYVEGSTDVEMLRAFALKAGHPAAPLLGDRLNVYYTQDNYPQAKGDLEAALERVEGGFGATPKDHFFGLKGLVEGLRGLALLDSDATERSHSEEGGLLLRYWDRYELENYFVTPALLSKYAARHRDSEAVTDEAIAEILQTVLLQHIFNGSTADLAIYNEAEGGAADLIWRQTTRRKKLSTFAEDFFRKLGGATGTPMLLRKSTLYQLIPLMAKDDIPQGVIEALDVVHNIISHAELPE